MTNSGRWGSLPPRTLKLPSQLASVERAVRALFEYVAPLSLEQSVRCDLEIALIEAVSNAIKYGHHLQPHLLVEIRFALRGRALQMQVKDQGQGFDCRRVPDPTAPENLDKTAGRGIFLMRRLMDEVRYNRRGNELTLVKRLAGTRRAGQGKER